MQSGIIASSTLRTAFANFTDDSSLFALPITIANESLQPEEPLPFKSSSFTSSLPSLEPHIQPKTPIYLILRRSTSTTNDLVAITYIPSTAPVRAKTLFASTRSTLVRDLGLEKFNETLFATDAKEILDPSEWEERSASAQRSQNGGVDNALLSTEERELQKVKRAEEEERHGTSGRDLMGHGGSGGSWAGSKEGGNAQRGGGIRMNFTDEAKEAFAELKNSVSNGSSSSGNMLVQFGIDLSAETLTLLTSSQNVDVGDIPQKIPTGSPSYTFYHHPSTESVLFIYTCPSSSKIKEKMTYASSKNGIIEIARGEGVVVTKKMEAGGPEDITEQSLREELGVADQGADSAASNTRQGFARPKRPGKR